MQTLVNHRRKRRNLRNQEFLNKDDKDGPSRCCLLRQHELEYPASSVSSEPQNSLLAGRCGSRHGYDICFPGERENRRLPFPCSNSSVASVNTVVLICQTTVNGCPPWTTLFEGADAAATEHARRTANVGSPNHPSNSSKHIKGGCGFKPPHRRAKPGERTS